MYFNFVFSRLTRWHNATSTLWLEEQLLKVWMHFTQARNSEAQSFPRRSHTEKWTGCSWCPGTEAHQGWQGGLPALQPHEVLEWRGHRRGGLGERQQQDPPLLQRSLLLLESETWLEDTPLLHMEEMTVRQTKRCDIIAVFIKKVNISRNIQTSCQSLSEWMHWYLKPVDFVAWFPLKGPACDI